MPGAHDHLSVRDYGASHGSHDHDHFQILVGLEGVLELEVAGRGQRIAAGDLQFKHALQAHQDLEVVVVVAPVGGAIVAHAQPVVRDGHVISPERG